MNGIVAPSFLIDGFAAGIWAVERTKGQATLRIQPFQPIGRREVEALEKEGMRLLAFQAPDAARRFAKG